MPKNRWDWLGVALGVMILAGEALLGISPDALEFDDAE